MQAHGKWTGFVARFYYATGSLYYAYHWFLIVGSFSLLAGVFDFFRGAPTLAAVLVCAAMISLGVGLAFGRRIAKMRFLSHNPGLKVTSLKIDYELKNTLSAGYVREVEAEVLFPVESYEAKFHWTGQGMTVGKAINECQSVDIIDHNPSADDICRVHFGETLPKGKKINFTYAVDCINASKPIRPFLGHSVDSPVKELAMRVRLGNGLGIKSYKRQIFMNSKANLHLWEEIVSISNPNRHEMDWVVRNPQNGLYYRLSW